MKRKLFTVFVTLFVTATTAFANGVCIDGLYYLLDKEKLTAIVTYKSYDKKSYVYNKNWDISVANIPSTVVYKNKTYRVTKIGEYAFTVCENLKSVTIPNSVTSIETHAFNYCIGLTSIEIPNSVTSIGQEAFAICRSLTSVVIPNSVTSLGLSAFRDCTGLTSVTINSVKGIGDYAFKDCKGLKSVTIGNSVTSIGKVAFKGCTCLKSVTIGNNVRSIGEYAFEDCSSLESVTMGNSVTSIGEYAFNNCNSLKSVYINDLAAWCRISFSDVYSTPFGSDLYLKGELVTDLVIPNSVKGIGNWAFYQCHGLKSVTIGNNVRSIGDNAFSGCWDLKTAIIGNSVTSIGKSAFESCSNLKSVTIGNSVTSIKHFAFQNCYNLASVTIPSSVTSIGVSAFYNCKNLTIYTSSAAVTPENTSKAQIVRVSEEDLLYYYPFSIFAQKYVETGINEWQKKGEFERVADWQKRVNETSRQQKIQSLIAEAQDKYITYHIHNQKVNLTLGKYDIENGVFAMTDAKYGTMYIAVPLSEAQYFKANWDAKKITPQAQIYDDEVKISALTISMPNGKKYTYRNTDAVTYNLADVAYSFDPIELDLPKSSAPQQQQGQQKVTTTKVKAGKSDVDTNIPSTNASNPNTFAIIFANEDYKNVASVPFAKNDGSIFQKYCQKTLGIPSSNIHYVENASFNDIRIQLAWLKDVCDAYDGKASVIVYYAGHGIPDEASKSAYLLPVDGDGRYVQSAYKIDEFYQKLGTMNAKSVTVFMDACFSGSTREDGMLASARGVAIKAKSGVPQGKMVVFSAAQGDETAYPNNDEGHGIFTYYLLKKLQETKGDVTLQDLGEYITTNVRRQSVVKNGKPQTPSVTPSASIGTEWQNWKLK